MRFGGQHAVAGRAVFAGRLQQPGQERAFIGVELPRRFAEIAPRRGIDAIGAGAEIDPVEIDLEQPVLAEMMLEPEGQQRLLPLAPQGAVGRQEDVLGELLGDGRAALDDMAGAQIGEDGARHAQEVEAEMAVEAPILGRDHRFRQRLRQILQRQRFAVEIAIGRNQRAIRGFAALRWDAGRSGRDPGYPAGSSRPRRAGRRRPPNPRPPPRPPTSRRTKAGAVAASAWPATAPWARRAPRAGRRSSAEIGVRSDGRMRIDLLLSIFDPRRD